MNYTKLLVIAALCACSSAQKNPEIPVGECSRITLLGDGMYRVQLDARTTHLLDEYVLICCDSGKGSTEQQRNYSFIITCAE